MGETQKSGGCVKWEPKWSRALPGGQQPVNFHDTSRYNMIGFTQLDISGHYASRFGIFGIAFVTASQQCKSFFFSA